MCNKNNGVFWHTYSRYKENLFIMNGTITEKQFEKMSISEKLWLLYNTMLTRDINYKKQFKRIYILISVLLISIIINGGSKSIVKAVKIMGIF